MNRHTLSNQRSIVSPVPAILLSLCLALTPLWPAFAAMNAAPASPNAQHMAHHPDGAPAQQADCDQYQTCEGHCCVSCMQCYTADVVASVEPIPVRAVRLVIEHHSHPRLSSTPPDRPPRALV